LEKISSPTLSFLFSDLRRLAERDGIGRPDPKRSGNRQAGLQKRSQPIGHYLDVQHQGTFAPKLITMAFAGWFEDQVMAAIFALSPLINLPVTAA